MQESEPNPEEKLNPTILKDDASSGTGPSTLTPIASVLLDWSNKTSCLFSSIKMKKPLPAPVQCLADQTQAQKPIPAVATDQIPDHTKNRE